jgi:hypothetical protein
MINNDTNAPAPTTNVSADMIRRAEVIAAAYAPEDCEECEMREGTCIECAAEALLDAGLLSATDIARLGLA